MNKHLLKDLAARHQEDILPPYNELIKIIGFEGLCAISDEFCGTSIYIPTKKRLFHGCVIKQVLEEFNGFNYKELSRKFDLAERTVRYITAPIKKGDRRCKSV